MIVAHGMPVYCKILTGVFTAYSIGVIEKKRTEFTFFQIEIVMQIIIVIGILAYRIIYGRIGYRNPCLYIRIALIQGGKIQSAVLVFLLL